MIKFKIYFKWALLLQLLSSLGLLCFFLFYTGQLMIGEGKFNSIIHLVETTDYRPWLAILGGLYFLMSLAVFILFILSDLTRYQGEDLRQMIYMLIRDKHIPVTVDIDENISVHIDHAVEAPFSVDTALDFDEKVRVAANIPVDINLPIDTVVETSVLGLGAIKIPIKTTLPIKMNFPFQGQVHMKVEKFKVSLTESAKVQLPAMDVPVKCQLKAKLNLESNLQEVENILRKDRGKDHG